MKEKIRDVLEQAEALDRELRRIRDTLGRYAGEQLNEAGTERQLDRWVRERGQGVAMDAAVRHMAKVLEEVRALLARPKPGVARAAAEKQDASTLRRERADADAAWEEEQRDRRDAETFRRSEARKRRAP